MLAKKKLLIVDDSAFMRKLIGDFFTHHPTIEVVGTARNGKDALQKIDQYKPDVVTMDVEMPIMNGLDAVKAIMEKQPLPIVMLSSTTQQGAENTLIAMENGAVDFIAKPSGTISLDLHKIQQELVQKVEHALHAPVRNLRKPVYRRPLRSSMTLRQEQAPVLTTPTVPRQTLPAKAQKAPQRWHAASKKIIVIGTSTGGPRALQEVITKLPEHIQAPILIVQHMPAGFTKSLANRLDQLSAIHVKEAEHGDILQNGTAYIAPGGYHMKLRKVGMSFGIVLDQEEPPRSGHRPAVDVMFESVSQYDDFDKIAVIMTGMGYDGSKGLEALKRNGHVMAIAESQNTCIVYGMPKAAVETQLVDEVADVEDIAQSILKYLP